MTVREWVIAFAALFALVLFLSPGFAYSCWDGSGTGARVWYTHDDSDRSGTTTKDLCTFTKETNMSEVGVTTGASGKWGEAYSYDGTGDYTYNTTCTECLFTVTDNFSWNVWIKTSTDAGDVQHIFLESDRASTGKWQTSFDSGEDARCVVSAGGSTALVEWANNAVDDGAWHMVTCVYFGSNKTVQIWVDGDYKASDQENGLSGDVFSANSRLSTGAEWWQGTGWQREFTGDIDDASLYNYSLSPAEILSLNDTGDLPAAPPTGGCAITLGTPADDDHTDDTTPLFNQTSLVCYGSMASRCYVTMNGTQSGDNSSTLVNGSHFEITANSSKTDGSYEWNISCIQGAITNTSTTRTLVIDTTTPTLSITAPSGTPSYYYADSNSMSVSCNDTNVYNLTCDVLNSSGVQNSYTNSTPVGNYLTLTNEFTSALTDLGTYTVNCSCSDSHTAGKWEADEIETGDGFLRVWKNGALVNITWPWSQTPDYEELNDRVKWSINAPIDGLGNVKVKFHFTCNGPADVIEDSDYAGHFICNNEFWSDFQDAADEGYDVKVVQEAWDTVEIEIEKDDAGDPGGWTYIDPAVGGLNRADASENFSIASDSVLYINTTNFYAGEIGYLIIYYWNITTSTLITSASCSLSITDPFNVVSDRGVTEFTGSYQGNFTPTYEGTHSYSVSCNATGWWAQTASGNFTAGAERATHSIDVTPESTGRWTDAYCRGDTLEVTYSRQVCFGSNCEDVNITEYEFCALGCLAEGGKVCRSSLIADNPVWSMIVLLMMLAIALFSIYAWARRMK